MKRPQLILFCLLFGLIAPSLTAKDKFKVGQLTKKEFESAKCDYDKTATAFYLYNYGETFLKDDLKVKLRVITRLKIVDKSALDLANIEIRYDEDSRVRKLKACTYNMEEGKLEITKLKKENVFDEQEDEDSFVKKVSFPAAKVGSVIEITYELEYGNYNKLYSWLFQRDYPVLHSEYHVLIPDFFKYQRTTTGYIAFDKADVLKETGVWGDKSITRDHHVYLAKNVPAFVKEPLSPARLDMISKIDFELKAINLPNALNQVRVAENYEVLANNLMKKDRWLRLTKKANWASKKLATLYKEDDRNRIKAEAIFDYVKTFEQTEEAHLNLRTAFDAEAATETEINDILIVLLREAGFEARAVLISTRSHGRINPVFPVFSQFNFTIAHLQLGSKTYLLDASESYNVFGVLPEYCINGEGLVIQKGPAEWVELAAYKKSQRIFQLKLKVDEDFKLKGSLNTRRTAYSAIDFGRMLEERGEEEYKAELQQKYEDWEIDQHEIELNSGKKISETLTLEIDGAIESLGEELFLNPVLYDAIENNPFEGDHRTFPIQFKTPYTYIYLAEIELPEGYQPKELPEAVYFSLGEKGASFSYKISQIGSKLVVNQQFKILELNYPVDDFKQLQEFYDLIIQKLREKVIVLKG